ncbi:MAG: HIT family protein [Ignavibacteria bacterium]|nr:HIT family protein [Ignavibacteria bacterium]
MSDCVFCKIASKEAPAEIIHETERVISFLDINPINFGHTLVIPKGHFKKFHEIPDEINQELIIVLSKVTKAITEALEPHGYNIFTNNGRFAGQAIMHCHFHIVPRYFNDGLKFRPTSKSYKKNEMKQFGDLIREKLKN